MTLATAAELTAYMGGLVLTPAQTTHVTNVILPGVQGELEKHCNRPLEVVHMRENRVPNSEGFIVFTVTPVWKVNFIMNAVTGTQVTLPVAPAPPDNLPAFVTDGSMRNFDHSGDGTIGVPFEYYVGIPLTIPAWPLNAVPVFGSSGYPDSYVCDYTGGWKGEEEPGLKLDILRVAARETERQFDDTMSIKGGSQEAAEDSDPRYKYWSQDELTEWDRLRRRVVV